MVVSLCVGICISFVGPMGFIGLVIPHVIKLIYKQSADKLFFQVFFGGNILVFSDLISRNLHTDSTLPIGVVTAFIGATIFLYLLIRRNPKSIKGFKIKAICISATVSNQGKTTLNNGTFVSF